MSNVKITKIQDTLKQPTKLETCIILSIKGEGFIVS
jgi:hypothetical protein